MDTRGGWARGGDAQNRRAPEGGRGPRAFRLGRDGGRSRQILSIAPRVVDGRDFVGGQYAVVDTRLVNNAVEIVVVAPVDRPRLAPEPKIRGRFRREHTDGVVRFKIPLDQELQI